MPDIGEPALRRLRRRGVLDAEGGLAVPVFGTWRCAEVSRFSGALSLMRDPVPDRVGVRTHTSRNRAWRRTRYGNGIEVSGCPPCSGRPAPRAGSGATRGSVSPHIGGRRHPRTCSGARPAGTPGAGPQPGCTWARWSGKAPSLHSPPQWAVWRALRVRFQEMPSPVGRGIPPFSR